MKVPLQGTGDFMVLKGALSILIPASLLTAIFGILLFKVNERKKRKASISIMTTASLSFLLVLSCFAWNWLELTDFILLRHEKSTYIEENYVFPEEERYVFPEKKRNLVMIFLESMEVTLASEENGGAKKVSCIPELETLSQYGESFEGDGPLTGATVMQGASFTAGSMFSNTSGLPLIIPTGENNMSLKDNFFPGIRSLGDILKEQGYQNHLLLGSDATFGGRRLYFTSHGNYDIKDYLYAQKKLFPSLGLEEDYYVNWGFEDRYLFQIAKNEILTYQKNDETFNLTMLTVDTHFPNGYTCEDCPDEFEDSYSNAYRCSSIKTMEFIKWFFQSGEVNEKIRDNTTFVLLGDHLTMDSDYYTDLDDNYSRRAYVCYLNSAVEVKEKHRRREYTAFDTLPTVLASLGVMVKDDVLGLGTNLFSNRDTLLERDGKELIDDEFLKDSKMMLSLYQGKSYKDSLSHYSLPKREQPSLS